MFFFGEWPGFPLNLLLRTPQQKDTAAIPIAIPMNFAFRFLTEIVRLKFQAFSALSLRAFVAKKNIMR